MIINRGNGPIARLWHSPLPRKPRARAVSRRQTPRVPLSHPDRAFGWRALRLRRDWPPCFEQHFSQTRLAATGRARVITRVITAFPPRRYNGVAQCNGDDVACNVTDQKLQGAARRVPSALPARPPPPRCRPRLPPVHAQAGCACRARRWLWHRAPHRGARAS